jgi:hypothetical protein
MVNDTTGSGVDLSQDLEPNNEEISLIKVSAPSIEGLS